MLIVVRHAEAVDRRDWTGADGERPLTSFGERQAEGLVLRLEDYPVERILTSPALRRGWQTVAPLARQRLVPVEHCTPLGLDAAAGSLLDLMWDKDIRNSVLCTHGTKIAAALALLPMNCGWDAGAPQWHHGSAWLLQRLAGRRVIGRYLPPLAHDPQLWPGAEHDPGGRVWGLDVGRDHLVSSRRRRDER
jgi:phosphohistidine phosphatase SixA